MIRRTNDKLILKRLQEGWTQKQIAEEQGVSPVAIHKRVKKLLHPNKAFKKLSKKEKRFVMALADGKSQTNAALLSHDCTSKESAKALGHTLAQKPDIQVAVSEIMQQKGLTRGYRVGKLKEHIDNEIPEVSLRALDQSWKLDGAYIERHEVYVGPSYGDVASSLRDDIKALLEAGMNPLDFVSKQELASVGIDSDALDAEFTVLENKKKPK